MHFVNKELKIPYINWSVDRASLTFAILCALALSFYGLIVYGLAKINNVDLNSERGLGVLLFYVIIGSFINVWILQKVEKIYNTEEIC